MKWIYFILLCLSAKLSAQDYAENIPVHDPVIIQQDSIYYVFCTGRGISCWSSTDRVSWKKEKQVFEQAPAWADSVVPGFKNHIWAPDIIYYQQQYYLFYSVSAFGKNTSAIGVATNKTLHQEDPSYHWVDQGIVIRSIPGISNFNAIDPNVLIENNQAYLSFGSFWGGLMLVKLAGDLLRIENPGSIIPIASRKIFPAGSIPLNGAGNAIEAPFIYKHGSYYYLFASIDYCCKGKESTYKMMVGRSPLIEGPYQDEKGKLLNEGGGTIVLEGDEHWNGVGHNAVARFNEEDYLVFHAYDATDKGRSKLRIEKITWDQNGWPVIEQ